MRTIKRAVPGINTNLKNFNKHFNQMEWKGIIENTNIYNIDQLSFADANNVYVDENKRLVSRDPLRKEDLPEGAVPEGNILVEIKSIGEDYVYVSKSSDDLYTINIKDNILEGLEKYHINTIEHYMIVFNEQDAKVYDVNNPDSGWQKLTDLAEIPIIKRVVGSQETEYPGNEFTKSYKEQYIWSNESMPLLPNGNGEVVLNTMRRSYGWTIPDTKVLTDYRILRPLNISVTEKDLISTAKGITCIGRSDHFMISYDGGDTFDKIWYPVSGQFLNIASISEDGNYFFFVAKDGVYRCDLSTHNWVKVSLYGNYDETASTYPEDIATSAGSDIEESWAHDLGNIPGVNNCCHFLNADTFCFMIYEPEFETLGYKFKIYYKGRDLSIITKDNITDTKNNLYKNKLLYFIPEDGGLVFEYNPSERIAKDIDKFRLRIQLGSTNEYNYTRMDIAFNIADAGVYEDYILSIIRHDDDLERNIIKKFQYSNLKIIPSYPTINNLYYKNTRSKTGENTTGTYGIEGIRFRNNAWYKYYVENGKYKDGDDYIDFYDFEEGDKLLDVDENDLNYPYELLGGWLMGLSVFTENRKTSARLPIEIKERSNSWTISDYLYIQSNNIIYTNKLTDGDSATITYTRDDTFDQLGTFLNLPTGETTCCALSDDGQFLLVGFKTYPYMKLYEINGSTFTEISKYSYLANPPAGPVNDCIFVPSKLRGIQAVKSCDFIVVHNVFPYITVYSAEELSSGEYTILGHEYPEVGDLPTGRCTSCTISEGTSYDDSFLILTHEYNPYITIYALFGESNSQVGHFHSYVKINFVTQVAGADKWYNCMSTLDGEFFFVIAEDQFGITLVHLYKRVGNLFPQYFEYQTSINTYPKKSTACAISPNNKFLAVTHNDGTIGMFTIEKNLNGELVFDILPEIVVSFGNAITNCCFSNNSKFLTVTHEDEPYFTVYEIKDNVFTKVSDKISTLPTGAGRSCSFSADDDLLLITHIGTPYLSLYSVPVVTENNFTKVPNVSYSDTELYLAFDNLLQITKNNKEGVDIKFNLPTIYNEMFISDITGIVNISTSEIALYFIDKIVICAKVEDETLGFRYDYYNTKLSTGIRLGDDIINTLEGEYTIFPTRRGLAAMNYQAYMATTDQTIQYISENIEAYWTKFYDESSVINIIQWRDFLVITNETGNILLYDLVNFVWWKWKVPLNVKMTLSDQTNLKLISDDLYLFKDGKIYKDFINDGHTHIDWFIQSQPLHMGVPNHYKNLKQLIFQLFEEDEKPTEKTILAQIKLYRKRISIKEPETINFKIEGLRTFVKRFNYWKINEVQWGLADDAETATPGKLQLNGISIKYEIGEEVR